MKKNMPVGVSDFKKVRENYYFVDKTGFIRELLDNHNDITLFTRPRRFGKTLTMSMLDYFFSVDKKDVSKDLFTGLAIDQAGPPYMQHQGQYPVIFLTLKGVSNDSWDQLYGAFTFFIQKEFMKHPYLWQSSILNPVEKRYAERIMEGTAQPFEYQMSLLQLTDFLARYFKKNVIVLIDEYDVPIQSAYQHGFYHKAIEFFRGWFNNTLKDNASLQFAILTGVLRIAKESIFSGLNNLDVYSVLSKEYGHVFGFTQAEVEEITIAFSCTTKLKEITDWYDGYSFGNTELYNPWSVTNYISRNCEADTYWANTSDNAILRDLLQQANTTRLQALQELMNGGIVRTSIDEGVIYRYIGQCDASLYSIMLNTGYLKAIRRDVTTSDIVQYDVKIPNKEVKQVYKREILSSVVQGLDINTFLNFANSLVEGNGEYVYQRLQDILLKMVSFYDVRPKESFYHGLLLGMTCLLDGPFYHVESNRESGYGRFDLAVFPTNSKRYGIIMEFKVAKTEDQLAEKAQEALEQIEEKAYITEFRKRQIHNVWKYGIAFCGKQVKVIANP